MANVGNIYDFALEFECPECGFKDFYDLGEIVDIGSPFCPECDMDIEMKLENDRVYRST
jgi:hypothetical protein